MSTSGSAVTVLGKPFTCRTCGHDAFVQREIKMQTTGMTFFDLDWLNESSDGVVCVQCGYVHMFAGSAHRWE